MTNDFDLLDLNERYQYSKFLITKFDKRGGLNNPSSFRIKEVVIIPSENSVYYRFNHKFPVDEFISDIGDNLDFFDVVSAKYKFHNMGLTLMIELNNFDVKNIWLLNECISISYNDMIDDLEQEYA